MRNQIVVEVLGGIVVEVYADDPETHVTLIDWDCDDESPCLATDEEGREYSGVAIEFPTTLLDSMPVETRQAFEHACRF